MRKTVALLILFGLAKPALAWDLDSVFSQLSQTLSTTSSTTNNPAPVATTNIGTPSFNPNTVYSSTTTSTGGYPVCQSRNATTKQSASAYQIQNVQQAY